MLTITHPVGLVNWFFKFFLVKQPQINFAIDKRSSISYNKSNFGGYTEKSAAVSKGMPGGGKSVHAGLSGGAPVDISAPVRSYSVLPRPEKDRTVFF